MAAQLLQEQSPCEMRKGETEIRLDVEIEAQTELFKLNLRRVSTGNSPLLNLYC